MSFLSTNFLVPFAFDLPLWVLVVPCMHKFPDETTKKTFKNKTFPYYYISITLLHLLLVLKVHDNYVNIVFKK